MGGHLVQMSVCLLHWLFQPCDQPAFHLAANHFLAVVRTTWVEERREANQGVNSGTTSDYYAQEVPIKPQGPGLGSN